MGLGSQIRKIREGKNITLTSLAEQIGITKAHLSDIELEKVKNPSYRTVKKIANKLDISVESLEPEEFDLKEREEHAFSFESYGSPRNRINEPTLEDLEEISEHLSKLPPDIRKRLIDLIKNLAKYFVKKQ